MVSNENVDVRFVVEAADRAEPKRQATDSMADTVKYAQDWLRDNGFTQLRIDRWEDNGLFVELGYVHGEVWFRCWKGSDTIRHQAATRKQNDLSPLVGLVDDVRNGMI